jgi:hypothetical protein
MCNSTLTCFNCEKSGHIIRECLLPRQPTRRTRFNTTKDVNYVELYDEEEDDYTDDNEYEVYQYEREFYPALRSGRQYSSGTKALHPKKVRSEIDELHRNTAMNAQLILVDAEMEDAGSSDSSDEEEAAKEVVAPKKTVAKAKESAAESKKKQKYNMLPAPIESLNEFKVAEYLQNLPCGLTVGQAAHLLPKYRSGMQQALRRKRDKTAETNMAESDEDETTTATKCTLRIASKACTAIIDDSGAATSIITRPLLEKLGYEVNRPSKLIVVTANGS